MEKHASRTFGRRFQGTKGKVRIQFRIVRHHFTIQNQATNKAQLGDKPVTRLNLRVGLDTLSHAAGETGNMRRPSVQMGIVCATSGPPQEFVLDFVVVHLDTFAIDFLLNVEKTIVLYKSSVACILDGPWSAKLRFEGVKELNGLS